MTKALNPVIGKSAGAHDGNLFLKSVIYGSKFSSALFSIIAIPVFLEAPYILKIWLKEVPEWPTGATGAASGCTEAAGRDICAAASVQKIDRMRSNNSRFILD